MELSYRWNGTDGRVRVEVRVNDDPIALGCSEIARGFPYCRASVVHSAIGYGDVLGWIQLVESSLHPGGFRLDYFEPLGFVHHPFAFYGWAPTLFDAPHSDEGDWNFLAHSFLCGLGGRLLDFRREAKAVLGFEWGFSKHDGRIESFGPAPLAPPDWDRHRSYLTERYGEWEWKFASGFAHDPLRP
jgi:hypothetical protein